MVNELMAPIPGMSLTSEPGNRPWEQPPQFTTMEEVAAFYSKQLTNVDRMEQIVDVLKRDVPIDVIVESMIVYGMMKGKHTIDAGMLVSPILVELIISVAEMYGVDYTVSAEDKIKPPSFSTEEAKEIVTKTEQKMKTAVEKAGGPKKGLMAKGEQ